MQPAAPRGTRLDEPFPSGRADVAAGAQADLRRQRGIGQRLRPHGAAWTALSRNTSGSAGSSATLTGVTGNSAHFLCARTLPRERECRDAGRRMTHLQISSTQEIAKALRAVAVEEHLLP